MGWTAILRVLRRSTNTGVTWASFLVRLVGQLGYFLLVARALGPHGYGIVASTTAILIIAASFAGWGADHILIKHVTAAPEKFSEYFGNALILTAATLLPLALVTYGISYFAVGMAPLAFAAFAVGELFWTRIHAILVAAFMAFEKGTGLFVVNTTFSFVRLATCAVAILASSPLDIATWAYWYLGGVTLGTLLTLLYTIRRLGPPRPRLARGDLGLGFHFCLYYLADGTMRDIDKPLVAYFAGPVAAGLYNASFRIVDATAMPLRALAASFYARFFKHGHQGMEQSFRFAMKVLPILLGYSVIAGVALIAGSDFLPLILGEKFAGAAPIVSRLAFLPVFGAVASIGGDVLTSTGRQRSRALVMTCLSLSPILLAWLLVPRWGAVGAAYASLGNGALLAGAIWLLVMVARRHAARRLPAAAAAEPNPI